MSARAPEPPEPPEHLSEGGREVWRMLTEAIGDDGWHEGLRPHLETAVRASCGIPDWCRARQASGELVRADADLDRYSRLLEEQGAALAALGVDGGDGASEH